MLQLKFFIKYLQSYAMKNILFILSSLLFYISLDAKFNLVFNEHSFWARKEEEEEEEEEEEDNKCMCH